MQVVEGYRDVPPNARGAVLAIGNFDGVHRGHQALIELVKAEANKAEKPAGVLVFDPHPRAFFRPDEPHFVLTSLDEKIALFEQYELDLTLVLPFDKALASLDADAFVDHVLVEAANVSHVIIGYDFYYGHQRSGSANTLVEAGAAKGFAVSVVEPVADNGEVYSSTAIRLNLAEGNVRRARACLGRPWTVSGNVVGGAKRGTGLGYPTANVPMRPGTSLGHGIYAVRVLLEDQTLEGAAYLGTRPTFDDGAPILEVFLFDFDGDIYGKTIDVQFIDHIRADRKFDSAEALIEQMDHDVRDARRILTAEA